MLNSIEEVFYQASGAQHLFICLFFSYPLLQAMFAYNICLWYACLFAIQIALKGAVDFLVDSLYQEIALARGCDNPMGNSTTDSQGYGADEKFCFRVRLNFLGWKWCMLTVHARVALPSSQHPTKMMPKLRPMIEEIREQVEKLCCQRIDVAAKPWKRKEDFVKQL